MKIADEEVERIEFTANGSSPVALNAGQLYIRKTGEVFEFYYHGKHTFRKPELSGKKAKSVTIFLGQHGSRGSSANDLVTRMYFDYLFFRKDNVNYENDIPNRYPAGSTLHIDGYAGKAYLDGVDCTGDILKHRPEKQKCSFYIRILVILRRQLQQQLRRLGCNGVCKNSDSESV